MDVTRIVFTHVTCFKVSRLFIIHMCNVDQRVHGIPATLLEMLTVRQWPIDSMVHRECTHLIGAVCATFTKQAVIWFDQPIRKDNTKRLMSEIKLVHVDTTVLLAVLRISQQAIGHIRTLLGRPIDVCTLATFTINPMLSSLVPEFAILSKEKIVAYLSRKNITKERLPCILRSDPVAAYLGARPGDILCDIISGIARTVIDS
jgi:DNA-directed RNA polymerase subunit H (RpoH/RPB5)